MRVDDRFRVTMKRRAACGTFHEFWQERLRVAITSDIRALFNQKVALTAQTSKCFKESHLIILLHS